MRASVFSATHYAPGWLLAPTWITIPLVMMRNMARASATLVLFAFVVLTWILPGAAQTSTRDLQVLWPRRVAGDKQDCTRQCQPLYKECLPNCEKNGQVPGVTKRSENCREDCSTLVSQCVEECGKRLSRY